MVTCKGWLSRGFICFLFGYSIEHIDAGAIVLERSSNNANANANALKAGNGMRVSSFATTRRSLIQAASWSLLIWGKNSFPSFAADGDDEEGFRSGGFGKGKIVLLMMYPKNAHIYGLLLLHYGYKSFI